MDNNLSRRGLLRDAVFAGGALLAAPLVANVDLLSVRSQRDLIDEAVQSLFTSGSRFEAKADSMLAPWRLRGTRHAVGSILRTWGITPSFRQRCDYSIASTCRPNFELFESVARNEGFNQFSGVDRSPHEREASILVADDGGGNVQAGQQYGNEPEISLGGIEPDLLSAEAEVLQANGLVAKRADLVRATLATGRVRQNVDTARGRVPCAGLETALGTQVVYVPPRYGRLNYSAGYVGILVPWERKYYWRGLIS
jgi:hypothetical protein